MKNDMSHDMLFDSQNQPSQQDKIKEVDFSSNQDQSVMERLEGSSDTQFIDETKSMNSNATSMRRIDDATSNFSGFSKNSGTVFNRVGGDEDESQVERIEEGMDDEDMRSPSNKELAARINRPETDTNRNTRSQSNFIKGQLDKKGQSDSSMRLRQQTDAGSNMANEIRQSRDGTFVPQSQEFDGQQYLKDTEEDLDFGDDKKDDDDYGNEYNRETKPAVQYRDLDQIEMEEERGKLVH